MDEIKGEPLEGHSQVESHENYDLWVLSERHGEDNVMGGNY